MVLDKKDLFYKICGEAADELESRGGNVTYDEFWACLKGLKEKYGFDGANSLNPVWWALDKTGVIVYDPNFRIGGKSQSRVIFGRQIYESFMEDVAEAVEEFEKRI